MNKNVMYFRYFVLTGSFKYRHTVTRRRAYCIIAVVWIIISLSFLDWKQNFIEVNGVVVVLNAGISRSDRPGLLFLHGINIFFAKRILSLLLFS